MNFFNKLGVIAASFVVSLGFIQVNSAEAASIGRSDFNSDATVVDFEGASGSTFTDGNLSITSGVVLNQGSRFNPFVVNEGYYDGDNATGIRLNFLEEVSALGMDFVAVPSDITLSVFDKSNNIIESVTLQSDSITERAAGYLPMSFIGLDVGSNLISYATIDTSNSILYDFAIDNVIYQSAAQSTPEPASMLGLLAVTSLGAASLKRKFAKAEKA